jgi:cellulose synthase/poly-beta-1,6-N-acetylglucosamine synthase-like glycosyltransferase
MDQILGEPNPPDAFVVVDGDSIADEGLLTALASHLERGSDVVQAQYLVLDQEGSSRVQLRSVAFLLFHWVRFAGRAALHLPCNLVGNGMLFSRQLIQEHPWDAFTAAEDLEYSLSLRLAGFRPVFAASGLVRGPVPASGRSAQIQRERWEGGRIWVARVAIPKLLRQIVIRRRISLLDAAVDLVVPPIGLLVAGALAGTSIVLLLWGVGLVPLWVEVPWLVSLAAVGSFVILGLRAAKAPAWMYLRLASTPVFLFRKIVGTVGVVRSRTASTWIRTERPSEIVH